MMTAFLDRCRIWLASAAALVVLALPLTASAADNAQIFKCTDASGNVTYQNEPCPKASKSGRIELFDNRWTATKEEREAEWRRNASDHRVVTGMPARWVREALGQPTEIKDAPTAGAAQLWLYTLPERSIQVGMLNDQVLWFRETPTARTGQVGERPATEAPAPQTSRNVPEPQISRSAPPVERPANLPTTRLAPPAPERPPLDSARSLAEMARPPSTANERPAIETPAAPSNIPRASEATTAPTNIPRTSEAAPVPSEAPVQAGPATVDTAQASAAGPSAATTGTAAKPSAARGIARGQDCKQALADLGPPTRQRDVPAVDTSSDPATEYFYESATDAARLRIVCSNGKVEGVDRSVAR